MCKWVTRPHSVMSVLRKHDTADSRGGWPFKAGLFLFFVAGIVLIDVAFVSGRPGYSRSLPATPRQPPRFSVWRSAVRNPDSVPIARHVQPAQAEAFAVVHSKPEPIPATLRRVMHRPEYGVNWNLAQRLPIAAHGIYWLLPGNGFLCILAKESGLMQTCAPTGLCLRHGLASVTLEEPPSGTITRRSVTGIAPDRAHKVFVHTGRQTIAVAVGPQGGFVLHDSVSAPPSFLSIG